jgi:hypothetical protein
MCPWFLIIFSMRDYLHRGYHTSRRSGIVIVIVIVIIKEGPEHPEVASSRFVIGVANENHGYTNW